MLITFLHVTNIFWERVCKKRFTFLRSPPCVPTNVESKDKFGIFLILDHHMIHFQVGIYFFFLKENEFQCIVTCVPCRYGFNLLLSLDSLQTLYKTTHRSRWLCKKCSCHNPCHLIHYISHTLVPFDNLINIYIISIR